MMDFIKINVEDKNRYTEIYPSFLLKPSKDLMIRGGDFYAIYDPRTKLWSKDEKTAIDLIDIEIKNYIEKNRTDLPKNIVVRYCYDSKSKVIDNFHHYMQKQCRDSYVQLDNHIVFNNQDLKREDYVTKVLNYSIEKGDTPNYDRFMDTIFDREERDKLEWAIGSIIAGDSKWIQKFIVLYGGPGTGKSTFLKHIVQSLFDGYYNMFEAKSLASKNNDFALAAFKNNPLVAIQHDGDLSNIADNTKLNSIISHEKMLVNEKFKNQYEMSFNSFLFMGTNEPVYITGSKSGLLRRLIDVIPSGRTLNPVEYEEVKNGLAFEKGAIAYNCLETYKAMGPRYYDDYEPKEMKIQTDDFYNFMEDFYYVNLQDGNTSTTANFLFDCYKDFCEKNLIKKTYSYKKVRTEAKDYFEDYKERYILPDGKCVRKYLINFKKEKLFGSEKKIKNIRYSIEFNNKESLLDHYCKDLPAQYANDLGIPSMRWNDVKKTLKDIDTRELHYVRLPINHIVIDFDLKDDNGEKSYSKNLEAASKFPKTYAELSKSGGGIHLHYIYNGNVEELQNEYAPGIEIKVFKGNSALRRKLTYCNDIPIATISGGLPKKKGEQVLNFEGFENEKKLRAFIDACLAKKHHGATKPEIDYLYKKLNDAYDSGMKYDVRDLRPKILAFANNSSNQKSYCVKLVSKMKWNSEEPSVSEEAEEELPIVFFDVEVFPNLFILRYKYLGDKELKGWTNPSNSMIESLVRKSRLVGFNNRRYDNHIIYAAMQGYSNYELFILSQRIISGSSNAMFAEAYNLSYADIYDFSSAKNKKSLKKWEIELGLHHKELGLPWDKPVDESLWDTVSSYCDNDVITTEAVWNHLQADYICRFVLSKISGLTVNDTTNSHSARIIFRGDKNPQKYFNYPDLSKEFPAYEFKNGKSYYNGEEIGEGGRVYAEPGIYYEVPVMDIESMHPTTIEVIELFGPVYTKRFSDLKNARLAIKHGETEKIKTMLDGALNIVVDMVEAGTITWGNVADALKTVINSVYGLTAANFDNPFTDVNRNKENVVAKRGALFMCSLKDEVEKRGYKVCHIKTDSIKIPNATPEIMQFVRDYGLKYGYKFDIEAEYEKMCLINKADYIAKLKDGTWSATGAAFSEPYVFKTLFSNESVEYEDLWATKQVTTSIYLDMNEDYPDVTDLEKEKEKRIKGAVKLNPDYKDMTDEQLDEEIAKGHNYVFIGKIGAFCPVKKGHGGGIMYRLSKDGKSYNSVSGTKGYRWLDTETIKNLGIEDSINMDYYSELIEDAEKEISKYGNIEEFIK